MCILHMYWTEQVGPNLHFSNFSVVSVGGGSPSDAAIIPPHPSLSYPPRYLGHRPAFGMFVRRAKGLSLSAVGVSFAAADGRPAFILSGRVIQFRKHNHFVLSAITAERNCGSLLGPAHLCRALAAS